MRPVRLIDEDFHPLRVGEFHDAAEIGTDAVLHYLAFFVNIARRNFELLRHSSTVRDVRRTPLRSFNAPPPFPTARSLRSDPRKEAGLKGLSAAPFCRRPSKRAPAFFSRFGRRGSCVFCRERV